MERFPFQETAVGEGVYIRLFYPHVDSDELIWHWDTEDRDIHVLKSGGWGYEQEGIGKRSLMDGEKFFISKGEWHRVIRGDGDLIVKVTKHD